MIHNAPYSKKSLPSYRQMEVSGEEIIVCEKVSDILITVYRNGYVTCRRGKEKTVFRLDDCRDYTYGAALTENEQTVPSNVFENAQWYFRLFIEAEDRLNANYERHLRRYQYSFDDCDNDYCQFLSDNTWEGGNIFQKNEKKEQLKKYLKLMTPKQQRVVILYFVYSKGIEEIAAELGVTHQAVSDMLKKAIRRVRKKEGISAIEIPRGFYNRCMRDDQAPSSIIR